MGCIVMGLALKPCKLKFDLFRSILGSIWVKWKHGIVINMCVAMMNESLKE